MKNWSNTKKVVVVILVLLLIAALLYQFTNIFGNTKGFFAFGGRVGSIAPITPVVPMPITRVDQIPVVNNCDSLLAQIKSLKGQMSANATMEQKVQLSNLVKQYINSCVTSNTGYRTTGNVVGLPDSCRAWALLPAGSPGEHTAWLACLKD